MWLHFHFSPLRLPLVHSNIQKNKVVKNGRFKFLKKKLKGGRKVHKGGAGHVWGLWESGAVCRENKLRVHVWPFLSWTFSQFPKRKKKKRHYLSSFIIWRQILLYTCVPRSWIQLKWVVQYLWILEVGWHRGHMATKPSLMRATIQSNCRDIYEPSASRWN